MLGTDDDRDASRFEMFLDRVRDLTREPFLDLKPAREAVHEARELADADDLARQLSNRGSAEKREKMVLAHGLKGDVAEDHHFIACLFEGS